METQIKAFYSTPHGLKFVTIFGYTTRAIPSLEINGVGKFSKNIKEKLIYVTKTRKLVIPQKRFVICVEMNELDEKHTQYVKWLEFPLLLMYWYLSGLIPIAKLDDCLSSGLVHPNGDITHPYAPKNFSHLVFKEYENQKIDNIKFIGGCSKELGPLWSINSELLLEHIPNLQFKHYQMASSSVTPA